MSLEGVRWLRVSWKGHSFVVLIGMKRREILCGDGQWSYIWFEIRFMACCPRTYQMALRSVLAIPLDMSRGLNHSHEGWVSLQPHDGHTPMIVLSDNKCWMIYPRLIPSCKQTTCTVLPSPCRFAQPTSSICPSVYGSEPSKRKNTVLSNAPRFAKQKAIFVCVMHVTFTFVFAFDRNFEILIIWNPGRDRLVTTATVSSTNRLELGSDLSRSLYFEGCMTCQLCSIKLIATR